MDEKTKLQYWAPVIETLDLKVEEGFAASSSDPGGYDDGSFGTGAGGYQDGDW